MSHERLVGRDMGLEGWHLVSPHPLVHSPINVLITSSKHMLHPGILTTENTENTRRVSKFGIMYCHNIKAHVMLNVQLPNSKLHACISPSNLWYEGTKWLSKCLIRRCERFT